MKMYLYEELSNNLERMATMALGVDAETAAQVSIAVSLKRIADTLDFISDAMRNETDEGR
jgi:hypothetical protein